MLVRAGTSALAETLGTVVMPTPGTKSDTTNSRTPITAGIQSYKNSRDINNSWDKGSTHNGLKIVFFLL